ncbi:N-acetylglucosamine-binding protein GbpA [Pseudomonas sp. LPH60]|uniref:N-acetylglucosamine-binding protein GbpA n=1 Tax=Pseudomonas sp. LPH60 TaxID=3065906 RepID=UPI00273CE058|nr:N-acetylglucosamine-binding protein GbpA [Pseudomonas sp. LPH60]MDP4572966.1 N-acetylglucosamine-binding protein GbpA [Pseudomonas sp. LPH60]
MISLQRARTFLKLPLALAIGLASITAQQAAAHGYIESPASRVFLCNKGQNTGCGVATYVPQGIEYFASTGYGHTSYPSNAQACDGDFRTCGPANGRIASAGLGSFGKLDEQTTSRWKKNTIKPGPNTFTWHYTAYHKTRNYQFYITKKDWNPNQPLTRDSFEMTPLLDEPWGGRMPNAKTRHTVNIPADRSGYHVLLAVWKVDDNRNSFYQVVDLNIDNPGAASQPDPVAESAWTDIGSVQPEALGVGDKVRTRVFTAQGEQLAKQVTLDITSAAMADKNTWTRELAKKVNAANLGYQMGDLNAKDQVVAVLGKNTIFAKKDSGITSVLIDRTLAVSPTELKIAGLQAQYPIKDGQVELQVKASLEATDPSDSYFLSMEIYDAAGKRVQVAYGDVGSLNPQFSTTLKDINPDQYDLVIVSSSKKGHLLQKTASFKVTPEVVEQKPENPADVSAQYDYVFPQGLQSYKAGTLVLQPKDGQVYECKPLPFSSYCKQFTTGMNVFEPGVGSSWEWGWIRR